MNRIAISTDSTADLPKEVVEKYNIVVNPLHVILDDEDYLDGKNIPLEKLFKYTKDTGNLPKTSASSVSEYVLLFEKLLEDNDYVIHFSVSSKLSSTYNSARLAAEEFDGRVILIDSKNICTGQGALVLLACDLRDEGKSAEEIVKTVNESIDKVEIGFVVNSLDNLYKGGRCTAVARFASKLLLIHLGLTLEDGKIIVKKHYRGNFKRCLNNYLLDIKNECPNYNNRRVFITHSLCVKDIVDQVVDFVKTHFNFKEIILGQTGSVISTHCGEGTIGIVFLNN